MEIVGLGSQVLECVRVRRLIDRHGDAFLRQVYTERETRDCRCRRHATEQFAAVWAAKEAVFRSLGTTWRRGVAWTDVELVREPAGPLAVEAHGATAEKVKAMGVGRFLVTTAHCRAFATATCVAFRDCV